MQPLVAVDFDGVLHEYHGWDGEIPRGDLIPGVVDAIEELERAGFQVVVFSARDPLQIHQWLVAHGLPELAPHVTSTKPKSAVVFFDDRAVHVARNRAGALRRAARRFLQSYQAGTW